MKKGLLTLLMITLVTFGMTAQINTPAASPSSTLEQMVGLTKVTIEYSRPSMKGRTIFADEGLVRYGEMWRTGANQATKVTFSDKIKIDGKELAKGSYALLTKPTAGKWAVHFYTYEKGSWSSYKDKSPAAAISIIPGNSGATVETFTIGVNNLTNTSASIDLAWENTMVSIPVSVEVDSKVQADIDRVMSGPSRGEYYSAARYYYDAEKELPTALEWIQEANKLDAKFWQLRLEAQILAKLGKHIDAIAAAEQSTVLAKAADNQEYVRRNNESIKEWKDLLAKKSAKKTSGK